MSCTGHTITLMPFPSVVARTASRPGTAGSAVPAKPVGDPKLLKSDEKRFFMAVLRGGWNSKQWVHDLLSARA
jgi:hypothetical protein